MKAGFGWELGPFELWDAMGVQSAYENAIELGINIAPWVKKMVDSGITSFYKIESNSKITLI